MGVQEFLISSSLLAVLAQRLVRRLCASCRQPYIPSDQDLRSLQIDPNQFGPPAPLLRSPRSDDDEDGSPSRGADHAPQRVTAIEPGAKKPRPVLYRPVGCEACTGTGYRGRVGIYELLVVDEPVRREVLNRSDANRITRVASERGMVTLRQDGARHVMLGNTSIEEVLAATQAGDLE
jgi:type II secretory ATPase GspE/PulE/Tfp pilus assembly ATPase PilB-like protein